MSENVEILNRVRALESFVVGNAQKNNDYFFETYQTVERLVDMVTGQRRTYFGVLNWKGWWNRMVWRTSRQLMICPSKPMYLSDDERHKLVVSEMVEALRKMRGGVL